MLAREPPPLANILVHQSEVNLLLHACFSTADREFADDEFRGPPRGGRFERFDDRRGGGYGGGRYDDNYRGSRYDDRERRSYGRRDDYGSRGIDRYASSGRDDRYSSRGDDRRGGNEYYGRDAGRSSNTAAYGEPAPSRDNRDPYGGGRTLDDRSDDRYSRR